MLIIDNNNKNNYIKNKVILTINLIYESLNYDISIYVTNRLNEALADMSTLDISLITKIVFEVKEKWGVSASKIIEQMFNIEALKLNLLNSRSDDVN